MAASSSGSAPRQWRGTGANEGWLASVSPARANEGWLGPWVRGSGGGDEVSSGFEDGGPVEWGSCSDSKQERDVGGGSRRIRVEAGRRRGPTRG